MWPVKISSRTTFIDTTRATIKNNNRLKLAETHSFPSFLLNYLSGTINMILIKCELILKPHDYHISCNANTKRYFLLLHKRVQSYTRIYHS